VFGNWSETTGVYEEYEPEESATPHQSRFGEDLEMGASGWTYTTLYDSDIEAALLRLQEEVFERGDYYKPWEEIWLYRDRILAKPLDQLADHERQYIKMLKNFPMPDRNFVPSSIQELLGNNAESGTHSILDIFGIADEPTFGAATPVPDEELLRVYGTTQPTVDDVESVPSDIAENLDRWQAVYFIVYKDGQPHAIRFEGCSGD
jgi:hypothetical protein